MASRSTQSTLEIINMLLAASPPEFTISVKCNNQLHRVIFTQGTLFFPDHDWQVEQANKGLGGEQLTCASISEQWRQGKYFTPYRQALGKAHTWRVERNLLRKERSHQDTDPLEGTFDRFGRYFLSCAAVFLKTRLPRATSLSVRYIVAALSPKRTCLVNTYELNIPGVQHTTVMLPIQPYWWQEIGKKGRAIYKGKLVLGIDPETQEYYVLGKYHPGNHPYFSIERRSL